MGLTAVQIERYWEDGYVLLPGLIPPPDLSAYDARVKALVNGDVPVPAAMKIMRDVMVVKGAVQPQSPLHGVNKLLCLENDSVLFGFVQHPALLACLAALLPGDLYSLSSNVFNKPPHVDGRHPLHQDLRYFRLRPAEHIVGVWTALLPTVRNNGALAVIPGSHRRGLMSHAIPDWPFVNHGFYGVEEVALSERQHIDMQPGDTLLFHPLLIHGSGRNRSDQFRRAISAHYAAGDSESPQPDWRTRGLTRCVFRRASQTI